MNQENIMLSEKTVIQDHMLHESLYTKYSGKSIEGKSRLVVS